jgi:hypothetical protein
VVLDNGADFGVVKPSFSTTGEATVGLGVEEDDRRIELVLSSIHHLSPSLLLFALILRDGGGALLELDAGVFLLRIPRPVPFPSAATTGVFAWEMVRSLFPVSFDLLSGVSKNVASALSSNLSRAFCVLSTTLVSVFHGDDHSMISCM